MLLLDFILILGRDKQDVIVGEFIDHYQNLTMKSLLGIQWFNNECDRSHHFLSIDDDVFPNLNLILSYIKNNDEAKTLNCLYNMVQHAKVTRKGKWSTGWTGTVFLKLLFLSSDTKNNSPFLSVSFQTRIYLCFWYWANYSAYENFLGEL